MKEHEFTLYFDGADMLRQDHFDAAFEAGCDDASFAAEHDRWYGMFHREAPSFGQAVFSAIHDLESAVSTLRVTRLELDDFVTQTVIARRTGRSRESIRLLTAGKRGPGGFPKPVDFIDAGSRMWEWNEVARWFQRYEGQEPEAEGISHFTRALNGVLEARRQLAALAQADPAGAPTAAAGLLKLLDASVTQSARESHAA